MSKLRVGAFSISLDGYGAGPDQRTEEPLGTGGEALHDWYVPTRTFQKVYGRDDGIGGVDDEYAARTQQNLGAWIMGRGMFGPVSGVSEEGWKGWWGPNPPYHGPVFVLTHKARPPIPMEGGTTFTFVTEGIEAALEQARAAAKGKDVLLVGGVETIRQYLRAGLIDEMHVAISPILLGSGEHLLAGLDMPALGYKLAEHKPSPNATHLVFTR